MAEYGPATYGERIAGIYDRYVEPFVGEKTSPTVEFLAELAGAGRRVLELGVGTGRIALRLAERGLDVQGIDASQSMVDRLHAKPGGAAIPVRIGDFASIDVEGRFDVIYVVFNTFFALLEQEEQIRCFDSVAAHLADDGAFVIEAFVPDPSMYDRGQRMSATRVEPDRVELSASRLDLATQRVASQHILIGSEGIVLLPVQLRYAWPSELDLMARLGGMRLRERFGGWLREPFTSTSPSHVSVYELRR